MEYIDLGLPSGTLWSKTIAPSIWYGKEQIPKDIIIPTQEQFKELQSNCEHIYKHDNNTVYIQSRINYKFITIPLVGWEQLTYCEHGLQDSVLGKTAYCFAWINGDNIYDYMAFGRVDYFSGFMNIENDPNLNFRLSVLGVSKSPLFPTIF